MGLVFILFNTNENINTAVLSAAVILSAVIYCRAFTALPNSFTPAAERETLPESYSQAQILSEAEPNKPSRAEVKAASAADDTGRDDGLLDDIPFDSEDDGGYTEMGGDFAIDGIKPSGGRVYEILPNGSASDSLWNINDCRAYSLRVSERGIIDVGFSFNVSETAGTPWIVYLYEAYSSDGSGGVDSYRRLYSMNISSSNPETQSEKIGVYPGEYIILVKAGNVCSVDEYTLRAGFSSGIAWEAEPNDTMNRYTELPLGVKTGGNCRDAVGGDDDWYMVELPERGVIDIVFEHSDEQLPQVGWFVTLVNGSGDIIYRGRSYYKDVLISSGEIGLEEGCYFIKVSSHIYTAADYYITCKYEAVRTYETEMNDTPETADIFYLNGDEAGISGSISDKDAVPDKDYYRFEPDRAGVISLSFIHGDYGRNRDGWRVSLTDENGRVLYSLVSEWSDTAVTSPQIGVAKGVYYLKVDAEDMLLNSGTYIIGISYASGENWETERNDTFETADEIKLNEKIYGSLISAGMDYDADYFRFTVEKKAPVQIVFSHNGLAQDYEGWVVSLYNSDGKKITGFTSKWSDVEISSELINLAPGEYYIAVETGARFTDIKYSVAAVG